MQCIIKTHVIPNIVHPPISAILDESCIFYNAETQQHHANATTVENYQKKFINCDSDFKWDFALKWRPSWTPS